MPSHFVYDEMLYRHPDFVRYFEYHFSSLSNSSFYRIEGGELREIFIIIRRTKRSYVMTYYNARSSCFSYFKCESYKDVSAWLYQTWNKYKLPDLAKEK